jgi:hypothetical protein
LLGELRRGRAHQSHRWELATQALRQDRLRRGAAKGWLAGKHLVQNHPERVDVGPPIQLALTSRLLRAHVRQRPDGEPGLGEALAVLLLQRSGDAEIGNQGMALRQEDVLGLHISVHDTLAMRIIEGIGDFAGKAKCILNRHLSFPEQSLPQRLALDVRHRVPQLAGGFARVEHREDMQMLQAGCEPDLPQKALGAERLRELGAEYLERHRPIVPDIVSQVHRGHTAAPELPLEAIAVAQSLHQVGRDSSYQRERGGSNLWRRSSQRQRARPSYRRFR